MDIRKRKIINKAFAEKGIDNVIKWDIQKIKNEQEIRIEFISKDSNNRQGVWLKTDNGIEIPVGNNEIHPGILLWEDTAPKEVTFKCYTNDGFLSIYNVWDKGGGKQSQAYSSGMLIEELEGTLIYRCNDFGFETDFSDLVFSIDKI